MSLVAWLVPLPAYLLNRLVGVNAQPCVFRPRLHADPPLSSLLAATPVLLRQPWLP